MSLEGGFHEVLVAVIDRAGWVDGAVRGRDLGLLDRRAGSQLGTDEPVKGFTISKKSELHEAQCGTPSILQISGQ